MLCEKAEVMRWGWNDELILLKDFAPMLSCGKFKFNYKYFVYGLEHILGLTLISINNLDYFKVQETDCRVQIFQPYNCRLFKIMRLKREGHQDGGEVKIKLFHCKGLLM